MAGVLDGLRVLDLSWGFSGPMASMMLVDHGADCIKIEPPGGDPYRGLLGYKAWQRAKRSAILDLKAKADKDTFLNLVRHADILIESYAPGTTAKLGIDYATLSALNPRLIYASITAYGADSADKDRPGYDALVQARLGLHWEQRGWPEGALNHLSRQPDPYPDLEVPYEWVQGPPRPGPVFPASHWPSYGACMATMIGISAALRARNITGRGQHVEATLAQGALAASGGVFQRAEKTEIEGFNTWILGSKSPKGHYECSDGRWVHNWVPNPRFLLGASSGGSLNASPDMTVQNDPDRFGTGPEEILVMSYYQPLLADAVKKFPCDDWVKAAAVAEMTMQEARSVERALADPIMLKDGCVTEIDDPELGKIRQVGIVYKMTKSPGQVRGVAPKAGQHTDEVKAEAAKLAGKAPVAPAKSGQLKAPLAGIRVLDLGLAIAGPYGTQLLSDLGAEVIKVNALWDTYWHKNHIAFTSNRGKRSIALMLKNPKAKQILLDLVKTADVVQHNMRYDAAERLGVDYESLRKIKPDLIYCHTRGHERGPREGLPGNDQTAACLSGIQYEDGAMAAGGKPMWSLTSFGDTGNGFLSAISIIQALYHRDQTGEGQFCETAIVYAGMLNTSYAMAKPDGTGFDRPRLDVMQLGFNAGCRLYETAKGWICIVASTESHWDRLFTTLDVVDLAAKYPDAKARKANDKAIAGALEVAFKKKSAAEWSQILDRAGVPAEVSSETASLELFDKKDYKDRKWTVEFQHPTVGRFEQVGLPVKLSDTPGVIQGPPLMVGDNTEALLRELGRSSGEIDALLEEGVIAVYPARAGAKEVKSPWDSGPSKIPMEKK